MSRVIGCPHCYGEIPFGARVCRGCEAEVEYGAPRAAYWTALAVGVLVWVGELKPGPNHAFGAGLGVTILLAVVVTWLFRKRIKITRAYRT